jgi:hypothetical protein
VRQRRTAHPFGEVSHTGETSSVRPAFLAIGVVLTGIALVAFPAQDLPILFKDDTAMIGLSLVIFAVAAAFVATLHGRDGTRLDLSTGGSVVIAILIAVIAVAGYKLIGAIGWPTWRILVGPVTAGASATFGYGAGRVLRGAPGWIAKPLAGLVAAVVAAMGGATAVVGLTRDFQPATLENCQVRNGVRYCAIDGFEPLIDDWANVVESVLAQVPSDGVVRLRRLPVVQHGDEADARLYTVLAVPLTGWGRSGSGEGNAQTALALDVASTAVEGSQGDGVASGCAPDVRARDVVIWWLAGQMTSETADQVRGTGAFADNVSGTNYAAAPVPSVAASRYAARLLDLPRGEVGRGLRAEWDRFTGVCTSATELERHFDLPGAGRSGRGG